MQKLRPATCPQSCCVVEPQYQPLFLGQETAHSLQEERLGLEGKPDLLGPQETVVCSEQAPTTCPEEQAGQAEQKWPRANAKSFFWKLENLRDIWKLFSFWGSLRGSGVSSLGHPASESQRPGFCGLGRLKMSFCSSLAPERTCG